MNRVKYGKVFGLLAALFTGAASIVAGDYVTGIGIIGASFSSLNLNSEAQQ